MIRLKGSLDLDLLRLGLKSGDIIEDHTNPLDTGAIYFTIRGASVWDQECVVWKENYDIIGEIN